MWPGTLDTLTEQQQDQSYPPPPRALPHPIRCKMWHIYFIKRPHVGHVNVHAKRIQFLTGIHHTSQYVGIL